MQIAGLFYIHSTHVALDGMHIEQVLSKVIWEECVATSHGRECIRLIHELLTAQCSLQTSLITQPQVRYVHTAVPHASLRPVRHCTVRSPSLKKRSVPLP